MSAEIITVGDELLRGEVVNTNGSWLAEELSRRGFPVSRITAVGDELLGLADAVSRAASRCRLVVLSGGLGPTDDDRTTAAVAQAAGVELQLFAEELDRLRRRFARRGFRLTPNNEKQAYLPAGARVLQNRAGTAPGFTLQLGAALVACLPGVPAEMKRMFEGELGPRLAELGGVTPLLRRLSTFGVGESHLDHKLAGVLAEVDPAGERASLHYRTSFPLNHLVLVVRPEPGDPQLAPELLGRLEAAVRGRVGQYIFGADGESFGDAVVAALKEAGATVALAESCTGGLTGDLVTSAAGSSEVFQLGVVAYHNTFKERLLGVHAAVLAEHGAVSRPCVEAMARGVRELAGATYGVAVSGIAGPGGGTPDKPVGTVHFGLAGPDGVEHEVRVFPFDRRRVKVVSAHLALALVLRRLGRLELAY